MHLGKDIGVLIGSDPTGSQVNAGLTEAAKEASVWIDFTVPNATLLALTQLKQIGVSSAVVGTTGFAPGELKQIEEAAKNLAIVKAGNFSLGINLLEALVRQASARLGEDWDIEILETHHRRKIDAPSGTALMLGRAAADGRGVRLETVKAEPYDGVDAKREPGKIGFSVRRSGGVIGEHEVTFASDMEVLSLSHTAIDRCVFAMGAIRAAEWVVDRPPGLYGMDDVLGL